MKFIFSAIALLSVVSAQNATTDPAANTVPVADPTAATQAPATTTNTGSMTGVGDFIFDTPSEKWGAKQQMYKAGDIVRIIWHVQPATLAEPGTCKLMWRQGTWPNVSPWGLVFDTDTNNGYYDWTVPFNFGTDVYILQLSTFQMQPQVRNRTSPPFKVYQGVKVVNGKLILPDSSASTNAALMFSVFVGAIVALML